MASGDGTQAQVSRDDESRVKLVYREHKGDARVEQELPLVIGVIADLSGDDPTDRGPLIESDRQFRHIHRDNFDAVLAAARPRVELQVDDVAGGRGQLRIELEFREFNDFHPDQLVGRIAELRALRDRRKRLENLLAMLANDPRLEHRLQEIVDDPAKRKQLLDDVAARRREGRAR